jgi:hypothetical protein
VITPRFCQISNPPTAIANKTIIQPIFTSLDSVISDHC